MFIGHSFGDRLAVYIAANHPELVEKLVLTDAAGVENRNTLKLKLLKNISKLFKASETSHSPYPIRAISRTTKRLLFSFTASKDYRNASPTMRETLKKVVELNLSSLLPSISSETLILWGEHDNVTLLKDAQLMKKLIPDSKLEIIPEAEHNPHLTHTEEWTNHVLKFLKS